MGNFCARCGRPLQGGEVCNCMTQNTFYGGQQGQVQASASQSQMGYQIPPVQPQMGYQMPPLQQTTGQSASGRQGTGGKADQITGNLLGILKRPVTMGSEAIAVADLKTAFIFFALQGIASALFAMVVGHSLFTAANSGLAYLGGGTINFPYFRALIVTVIVSVLQSCILALLLWGGHALMQCGTTYPKMMSAAAIRSAVMIPTILVSIILFVVSPGIGFSLFVFGNIWGFLTMATAMAAYIPDKRQDIFPLIVSILILVFVTICGFIMSKAVVYYVPDSLSDFLDLDLERISENVMMFF